MVGPPTAHDRGELPAVMAVSTLPPASPSIARSAEGLRKGYSRRGAAHRRALDPDVFVLWTSAARPRTPNSVWRADRQPGREDADGLRSLAALVVGQRCTATAPAALSGKCSEAARPAELSSSGDAASPSRRPGHLDGAWLSRQDGKLRGHVVGGQLHWEEDGSVTSLIVRGERGNIIAMNVDGKAYSGVLSEDDRLLRWGDGDLWVRLDEFYDQVSKRCIANNLLEHEDLHWAAWRCTRSLPRVAVRQRSRSLAWEQQEAQLRAFS